MDNINPNAIPFIPFMNSVQEVYESYEEEINVPLPVYGPHEEEINMALPDNRFNNNDDNTLAIEDYDTNLTDESTIAVNHNNNDDRKEDEEEDDADGWQHYYNKFKIIITTDDPVESLLLKTYLEEVRHIHKVIAQKTHSSSLSDIVSLFIKPLIPVIINAVNSTIEDSDDWIGSLEVIQFIRCIIVLTIYQRTPSKLFKKKNLFPLAKKLNEEIFDKIYLALNTKPHSLFDNSEFLFDQPFSEDQFIREGEDAMAKINRQFFIRNLSILSTDDDHLRLSSSECEDLGIPRKNNPEKAFGPVSTGVVSLTTGITLATRISGRREKDIETIRILCQKLFNQDLSERVQASNLFALDRGYLNKELIQIPKVRRLNFFNNPIGKKHRLTSKSSLDHLPTNGKRNRCILCQCETTVRCINCQVMLCKYPFGRNQLSCFERFHKQPHLEIINRDGRKSKHKKTENKNVEGELSPKQQARRNMISKENDRNQQSESSDEESEHEDKQQQNSNGNEVARMPAIENEVARMPANNENTLTTTIKTSNKRKRYIPKRTTLFHTDDESSDDDDHKKPPAKRNFKRSCRKD